MKPAGAPKAHLFICRPGFEQTLKSECEERFHIPGDSNFRAAVTFPDSTNLPKYYETVFARQYLPRAMLFQNLSLEDCAQSIIGRFDVMAKRNNRQTGRWTLHAFAVDVDNCLAAAKVISKKLLAHVRQKHPEFQKRYVEAKDFPDTCKNPDDIVLQIFVSAEKQVWFSIGSLAEGIHPFEGGFQRMRTLKGAPSRSASKLEEALLVMNKHPESGQTAVDLGAAPGGWSFVMARYGANVQAIDHAKLDESAFKGLKGTIEHITSNGLTFEPLQTVDWLVCDMVISYRDTLSVLKRWQKKALMRHFVINIKLSRTNHWQQVRDALAELRDFEWTYTHARHLLHDRNEITLIGYK
jgi:23S rRNA C2498 (ribose-2'-O)-methylase RlmM